MLSDIRHEIIFGTRFDIEIRSISLIDMYVPFTEFDFVQLQILEKFLTYGRDVVAQKNSINETTSNKMNFQFQERWQF